MLSSWHRFPVIAVLVRSRIGRGFHSAKCTSLLSKTGKSLSHSHKPALVPLSKTPSSSILLADVHNAGIPVRLVHYSDLATRDTIAMNAGHEHSQPSLLDLQVVLASVGKKWETKTVNLECNYRWRSSHENVL